MERKYKSLAKLPDIYEKKKEKIILTSRRFEEEVRINDDQ